jgi:hypothetical protein
VVAGHVQHDLGIRVHRLDALGIAAAELADQRNVHAADEADGAGLRGQRGHHADQVAALMLVEDHRLHVRRIDHHVDDGELGVGKVGGHLGQHVAEGKAGHHDGVGARLGQTAQRLFALRFVLHLQLLVGAAGFLGPTLGAVEGGLVERLVELAAQVEDDGGFCQRGAGHQGQGGRRPAQRFHQRHGYLSRLIRHSAALSAGGSGRGRFLRQIRREGPTGVKSDSRERPCFPDLLVRKAPRARVTGRGPSPARRCGRPGGARNSRGAGPRHGTRPNRKARWPQDFPR